ncbi:MAG TPA: heme-binding protein [Mycobacterium sp.]|nr:heme-binding protein [Mycobacterium sp.]HQC75648.1 heme-binding protein [Mycobacterium sp.]
MLNKIIGAAGQVAEAAGTIVGIRHGTEEPSFTVERTVGDVEIRRYGTRIAAETSVDADEDAARNEGFRRLAGYIFGGNTARAKIAMTAPVAQQNGKGAQQNEKIAMTAPVAAERGADGQWVIRFFMPSEYTLESLPTPNDDRVRLVTVPPDRVAVLRFAGMLTNRAVAERTEELLKSLRDNGIEPAGEPMGWFYDPPWTLPFLRRNEVVVSIGPD